MLKQLSFIALGLVSTFSYGADLQRDLLCEVKGSYMLLDDGYLNGKIKFVQPSIGKKFSLNADSGVISGYMPNNKQSTPQVISTGSGSGQYASISFSANSFGEQSLLHFSVILDEKMPFMYVIRHRVLSGHCEYF